MDYISRVESLLAAYCSDKISQASVIDTRYSLLWQEMKDYLLSGGKRIRPRLVMLAYNAYGGQDETGSIPVAVAWELLHACLLVHDDIIDRDTIRHGHPNIAGRYQAIYSQTAHSDTDHYALSAALLGGDLLLMSAYEMVNTAAMSDNKKLLVQQYLNKALFTVAGGELIDTELVLYPLEQSNPSSVAVHKTASYSLQLPLQCGAALAGAPDEELQKLDTIGLHAGIAYQLCDDLLGVYGDSTVTGKSNRSDIVEKKRTFLVQEALKTLNSDQVDFIKEVFTLDRTATGDEAEKILELITLSGAKERIIHRIETESTLALESIASLSISDQHKCTFSDLITKLTTRTS